jgi:PKD repeat protein
VTLDPAGSLPDAGTCAISGYNWDFGDGETGIGSSIPVTHTYARDGTYTVELEVTNQGGSRTTTKNVTVPDAPAPPCAKPVANFTWKSGNPRRDVTFTDLSTADTGCPVQTWLWDFGDGSPASNAPNPTHSFPKNNGSWSVTLTVTNSGGSTTLTRPVNL